LNTNSCIIVIVVVAVVIVVTCSLSDEACELKPLPLQESVTRTLHDDHTQQHIDDITVNINNTPQRPIISDSVFTTLTADTL